MTGVETDAGSERVRTHRAEGVQRERRRRRRGTLNTMVQMKLDVFSPDQLDTQNYVYRWCNDEDSRLAMLTRMDDYDFCESSDIKGFDAATSAFETDSESQDRVRMVVGSNKGGQRIYAYLLKKRRDWWQADQEEAVIAREEMMKGRVYRAEVEGDTGAKNQPEGTFYAPNQELSVGGAAERRRGPIAKPKGL
jgi:hypothetical protein